MKKTDVNDTFLLCFLPCFFVLCIVNNMNTGASYLELFLQGLLSASDDSEPEPSLERHSLGSTREMPNPRQSQGHKWVSWKCGLEGKPY